MPGFLGEINPFREPVAGKSLKKLWVVAGAHSVLWLTAYVVHLSVMSAQWGMWAKSPELWTMQLFAITFAFLVASNGEQENMVVPKLLWLTSVIEFLLCIPSMFWVFSEITICNRHSSETTSAARDCYQQQGGTDAGQLCLMEKDFVTTASGVCPQIQFGSKALGAAWSAWQVVLIFFVAGISVAYFYYALKVLKVDMFAEAKGRMKRMADQNPTGSNDTEKLIEVRGDGGGSGRRRRDNGR